MTDLPPAPHELEISVFGPGIGESIVAHLGDGEWIIVDSCVDRRTGQPASLDYLRSMQIDVSSQVKLIVATYWHDDHIQGMAEILHVAKDSRFVDSAAYSFRDLVRLVELGSAKTARHSSATKEYAEILSILAERKQSGELPAAVGPVRALANRRLLALHDPTRTVESEVYALSPADGVFNRAQAELQNALLTIGKRLRPATQGPNQHSVALWLRVGSLNVLLGADLENVAGNTEGWKAIVSSSERPKGRARYFKVPHHGSENADSPECWKDLLLEQPVAVMTAYSPSRLPKPSDVARLCARTSKVYLTSDPAGSSLPNRDKAVDKTLKQIAINRRALVGRVGHVRFRCDARSANLEPRIELINGAQQRCERRNG